MVVRIFTDGACSQNPGPGGWGVIFSCNDKINKMSNNELFTTNNRMELRAVIEALKKIEKSKHKNIREYEIYSDSAYVVNTINSNWLQKWEVNGWKTTKGDDIKNRDLWSEFNHIYNELMSKKVKLKIIKVKGHAGNPLNEMVDKVAKKEVEKAKRRCEY